GALKPPFHALLVRQDHTHPVALTQGLNAAPLAGVLREPCLGSQQQKARDFQTRRHQSVQLRGPTRSMTEEWRAGGVRVTGLGRTGAIPNHCCLSASCPIGCGGAEPPDGTTVVVEGASLRALAKSSLSLVAI